MNLPKQPKQWFTVESVKVFQASIFRCELLVSGKVFICNLPQSLGRVHLFEAPQSEFEVCRAFPLLHHFPLLNQVVEHAPFQDASAATENDVMGKGDVINLC